MFTGLIQDVGRIRAVDTAHKVVRLTIQTALPVADFRIGESVAVSGVCLTVVGTHTGSFQVEASPETLDRTNLGKVRPGGRVNLERALRLSDRLGGHLVTGHIDGLGRIRRRRMDPRHLELQIQVLPSMGRYLVEKGSVAVEGVSLTVNRCGQDWFDLTLIPHTIAETTLSEKREGDLVNVECDILGKYVEKFLLGRASTGAARSGGITEDLLKERGFL
jgi:riboflavin synthase